MLLMSQKYTSYPRNKPDRTEKISVGDSVAIEVVRGGGDEQAQDLRPEAVIPWLGPSRANICTCGMVWGLRADGRMREGHG